MKKEEFNRYREEEEEEVKSNASNDAKHQNKQSSENENIDNCDNKCDCKDCKNQESSNESQNDQSIEDVKAELKKYRDLYLRTLADTENFKKRINDERIKDRKYACYSFAEKLITSLDIFDKVVSFKPDDEKLKNYLIGFEMINNQLKQVMADEGVKLIPSLGEKFNPQFHHAVETVWDETKEEDIIVDELQRGYMFKDRVLRVATVKVNKKPVEDKKENFKEEK